MQTPWGELRVSDAHVHFFSHSFFQSFARQSKRPLEALGASLGWQIPPPEPRALAGSWVQELDRHGIHRAALIASIPGDEDSVAAAVAAFPGRFFGYFMFNPAAPDAAERLQRALASDALQAVCLFPAMHRYSVHDARVRPVFELAAARPGTAVFLHCGVLSLGIRKKLGLPSPFDMRFSNPIDLHAVALEFPGLNFVIPHFGAGYFREALMLCDLCPNVHLDTSSSNSWMRYEPAGIDLKTVFRRALDVAGAERLLFGTDSSFFPRGWQSDIFQAQAQALGELGIGAAAAARIFSENLERLLTRAAHGPPAPPEPPS